MLVKQTSVPVKLVNDIAEKLEVSKVRPLSSPSWLVVAPASSTSITMVTIILPWIWSRPLLLLLLLSCWVTRRAGHFFEHKDTVETDNFPLLLNLLLAYPFHSIYDHTLVQIPVILDSSWILVWSRISNQRVEVFVEIYLFHKLEAIISCDLHKSVKVH